MTGYQPIRDQYILIRSVPAYHIPGKQPRKEIVVLKQVVHVTALGTACTLVIEHESFGAGMELGYKVPWATLSNHPQIDSSPSSGREDTICAPSTSRCEHPD